MFGGETIGAGSGHLIAWRRPGVLTCALGLVICLIGCQPRENKAPPLPPPLAPVASLPRPARPTFYVTINRLNLRTCPGLDCPKTSSLDLNAEVEKMGEVKNWTQVKVKKDGAIGYVSSRYLSLRPVEVAKLTKKKPKQARHKHPRATQPPIAAGDKQEKQEELYPPLPHVM